jgi:hypothetical protein
MRGTASNLWNAADISCYKTPSRQQPYNVNRGFYTILAAQFFWLWPDDEPVFNALRALASTESTGI